ncbi:hypothetical protein MANES_03G074616v8, partial [Manihot esculenta]
VLHGIAVARQAPQVSHRFFADDSYFFYRASKSEILATKDCLALYEVASRQKINFQKSTALFTRNISHAAQVHFSDMLHVPLVAVTNVRSYLGLPSLIGKKKNEIFRFEIDRVWRRMQGGKDITFLKLESKFY